MLHQHTVRPELLELLNKISELEIFSDFALVGGTALALQIGHRTSVDLDFFSSKEINTENILEKLEIFGNVQVTSISKNILITSINDLKVDFVNYSRYPFITENIVIENIKMASKEDIAAMKLNAISNRGTKKDFIDLYFLLEYFSLPEMIEFYRQKYTRHSEFGMLKSITYFTSADTNPEPKIFQDFDWEKCKEKIRKEYSKLGLGI